MGEVPLASEPNCEGGLYLPGTVVTLTAQPAEGFSVHRWQGTDDDQSTELTNTVMMDADKTIGVHYVNDRDPYELIPQDTPGGITPAPLLPGKTLPDDPSLAAPSTVIGADNRTQVTNTTAIPWRRNAYIEISFPGGSGSCTGWFAGPDLVVTAGHCVYNTTAGGWADAIRVVPGKNGGSEPYGAQLAAAWGSVNGWVYNGLGEFDYGFIHLPNGNMGNQVGWYRYGYFSDTYLQSIGNVNVTGYPGDKAAGTLWTDNDPLGLLGYYSLNYAVDLYNGQSGSAVWYQGADGQYYAIGVVAYNVGGYSCAHGMNCGPRLQKGMADLLYFLGAANAPATDCAAIGVPTLLSPADNTEVRSDPISFSWTAVNPNGGYRIQLFDTQDVLTWEGVSEEPGITISGIDDGTVHWQVRALASQPGCADGEFSERMDFTATAPYNVSGLSASQGTYPDRVQVTWHNAIYATYYEVYRSTSQADLGDLLTSTTQLSFEDTSASVNTYYYYRVNSCNSGRCTEFGTSQLSPLGYRTFTSLAKPEDVTAISSASSVRLSWSEVAGAANYEVFRSDSSAGPGLKLSTTTALTFSDSGNEYGAEPYTPYTYRVRACNELTCSDFSEPVSGEYPLEPPRQVDASNGKLEGIDIWWASVLPGVDYFRVYRSSVPDQQGSLIATLAPTSHYFTTYLDTQTLSDILYYYTVVACAATGCGDGAMDPGWRAGTIPTPPAAVTAADGGFDNQIMVSWEPVINATQYEVYRSDTAENPGTRITIVPYPSTTDQVQAALFQPLYYRIKACNRLGCGDFSQVDAGYLSLNVPANVKASDYESLTEISVSWAAVTGVTSYQIYRSSVEQEPGSLIGSTGSRTYYDTNPAIGVFNYYR